jgi:DNA-binding NtrC family response regulator
VSYTIVFVDDEPWGLSAPLRLALESRDFNCRSFADVTSAWEFIQNNTVHVVITDIMMPGGTSFPDIDSLSAGFFFVKLIRRDFPKLPVICLSVIADQKKINELKKQNVLYLRKGETPLDTAVRLIESKATGRVSFG